MGERIPLGRALGRQMQRVVGVAQARDLVVLAGDRVGPGREHGVDRVPAAAPEARLRPVLIERQAEREDLAAPDQARGVHDVRGRDEVERPDLVVRPPAPPVLQPLRGIEHVLLGVLAGHHRLPCATATLTNACQGSQQTSCGPDNALKSARRARSRRRGPAPAACGRRSPWRGTSCRSPAPGSAAPRARARGLGGCGPPPLRRSRSPGSPRSSTPRMMVWRAIALQHAEIELRLRRLDRDLVDRAVGERLQERVAALALVAAPAGRSRSTCAARSGPAMPARARSIAWSA